MAPKPISMDQLADLIHDDVTRGIVSADLLAMIQKNALPKRIRDVRGAIRMIVGRIKGRLTVQRFDTLASLQNAA